MALLGRGVAWGMVVLGLLLGGCVDRGGSEALGADEVRELAGAGAGVATGSGWGVLQVGPEAVETAMPGDDRFLGAVSDPFAEDAFWKGAGSAGWRAKALEGLAGWRKRVLKGSAEQAGLVGAEGDPELQRVAVERAVSFLLAMILESRLHLEEGRGADSARLAAEAFGTAWGWFSSGPGRGGLELLPAVMITATNISGLSGDARFSREDLVVLEEALDREGVLPVVGRKVGEDFAGDGAERLATASQASDIRLAVARLLAREGDVTIVTDALADVQSADASLFDRSGTARLAGEWVGRLRSASRGGWPEVEVALEGIQGELESAWGLDPFAATEADWDSGVAGRALKESRNGIGLAFAYEVVWSYGGWLESAVVSQVGLDAARARVGGEIFRRSSGRWPRDLAEAGLDLRDPLGGAGYVADWEAGVLRVRGARVGARFDFVQALAESGTEL